MLNKVRIVIRNVNSRCLITNIIIVMFSQLEVLTTNIIVLPRREYQNVYVHVYNYLFWYISNNNNNIILNKIK